MNPPFCIFSTPRSRSTWLSKVLMCDHEPSRFFSGPEDIARYFALGRGAVDTALVLRAKEVMAVPGMRVIGILRPFEEVLASARNRGIAVTEPALDRLYDAFIGLDIAVVPWTALSDLEFIKFIFQRFNNRLPPEGWIESWMDRKVEPDILAIMVDMAANREGLRRLYG